jgi:hypothetical protein
MIAKVPFQRVNDMDRTNKIRAIPSRQSLSSARIDRTNKIGLHFPSPQSLATTARRLATTATVDFTVFAANDGESLADAGLTTANFEAQISGSGATAFATVFTDAVAAAATSVGLDGRKTIM